MHKLKKQLTLPQVISMAAGGMIAAWMVEIKYWFELSGTGSFWALATTAVLVLPLAFVYSEMSSMLPFAGGANIWVSNAFGWHLGWYFNWMQLLIYVLAMPTVSYGIVTMTNYFYPLSFIQTKIVALIVLVSWFFMTNKEIKILGKIQNTLFWIMIITSIFVSINLIFSGQWDFSNLGPWFPKGFSGYSAAVGILIFKYIGFDLIPQLSEEANFPRKHQWKAYLGAIGLTFLIYGFAIIGNGGIVSVEWISNIDIVDPRVADLVGKHWLAVIVVIVGILGTVTTLSGFWLSASRALYGAAQQRQLSSIFTRLNKDGQPYIGNIVVGILAIYFTVFAPEQWVEYIYTIYSFVAGIVYTTVVLSFLALRKKHPEWERPFKLKYGTVIGIAALAFTIWVILASLSEISMTSIILLVGYLFIGIAFHLYAKKMQKNHPEEWKPIVLSPKDIKKSS
ncbi:APC family permease [Senegalia massiliensis]|uniref:APC family permease n=1 Tax=Senegalia massiliensis TaxID=1720316 RepID=A0A845QX77_9CLOT|nr:APC family permease [Senegalia massiliensis]NBI07095.1 APC family permease [Senegalia massiliensis]